jgi:hypothetical protein
MGVVSSWKQWVCLPAAVQWPFCGCKEDGCCERLEAMGLPTSGSEVALFVAVKKMGVVSNWKQWVGQPAAVYWRFEFPGADPLKRGSMTHEDMAVPFSK